MHRAQFLELFEPFWFYRDRLQRPSLQRIRTIKKLQSSVLSGRAPKRYLKRFQTSLKSSLSIHLAIVFSLSLSPSFFLSLSLSLFLSLSLYIISIYRLYYNNL